MFIGPLQTESYGMRKISDWDWSEGMSIDRPFANSIK